MELNILRKFQIFYLILIIDIDSKYFKKPFVNIF
jgi:hypothetical protein